jgi:hypothetical protein
MNMIMQSGYMINSRFSNFANALITDSYVTLQL